MCMQMKPTRRAESAHSYGKCIGSAEDELQKKSMHDNPATCAINSSIVWCCKGNARAPYLAERSS